MGWVKGGTVPAINRVFCNFHVGIALAGIAQKAPRGHEHFSKWMLRMARLRLRAAKGRLTKTLVLIIF